MSLRCLIIACTLASLSPAAGAVEVLDARVARSGDGYRVNFAVRLDGDVAGLARVVRDYPRFAELSPSVTGSRVLHEAGDEARIELTFRPCVLVVFCRTIVKVSDTRVDARGTRLEFTAVPSLSDFHAARETIVLEDATANGRPRARFTYSAFLEPKFFVPPLVGPWLVRRHIIEDLESTSRRVERILQREAGAREP